MDISTVDCLQNYSAKCRQHRQLDTQVMDSNLDSNMGEMLDAIGERRTKHCWHLAAAMECERKPPDKHHKLTNTIINHKLTPIIGYV